MSLIYSLIIFDRLSSCNFAILVVVVAATIGAAFFGNLPRALSIFVGNQLFKIKKKAFSF